MFFVKDSYMQGGHETNHERENTMKQIWKVTFNMYTKNYRKSVR